MSRDKDKRLFIRLDLDYADHPKIAVLSDAAFRAHITMLLYSRKYETDGILKNPIANRLGSQWDTDVLAELQNNDEDAPSLLLLENGDYELHGYADMQETRAEIRERTRRNRENGAKGGRPRKPKETQSVTEPQTDMGTQNKAETETETETETDIKNKQKEFEQVFESVWASWPKKTERDRAAREFQKHIKDVPGLADLIRQFGEAYAATTEKQFTPSLAAWLHRKRWSDELPQPSNKGSESSRAGAAHSFIKELREIESGRSGQAFGDHRELR